MKRRMFAASMLLCFVLVLTAPVLALSGVSAEPCMVDDADLLSDYDKSQVELRLKEVALKQEMDVVVVTANSLGGKSPMEYADDYYDYNGYADDGVLLLVSMEDRDWWISTKGYGLTAFTLAGIDYIGEQITPDLGSGDYYDAFVRFADLADQFITEAKNGSPYDNGHLPKAKLSLLWIPIAIGLGALLALFPLGSMKSKLKTVRPKVSASNYVRDGSFQLKTDRDVFLYCNVSRTARPKNESSSSSGSGSHTSSSGSTHGGGGGKF